MLKCLYHDMVRLCAHSVTRWVSTKNKKSKVDFKKKLFSSATFKNSNKSFRLLLNLQYLTEGRQFFELARGSFRGSFVILR